MDKVITTINEVLIQKFYFWSTESSNMLYTFIRIRAKWDKADITCWVIEREESYWQFINKQYAHINIEEITEYIFIWS